MLRFKSNCKTTVVDPRLLVEVISVTPAMRPNWRSSGVATDEAIVSGLAPGRAAWTLMVGKSTWGRGATGNCEKATAPARATATVNRTVATGRRMNGEERLTAPSPEQAPHGGAARAIARTCARGYRRRCR